MARDRASPLGWCGLVALAAFLPGCPPGEEIAELTIEEGETEKETIKVTAGEGIHFWEDFDYRRTGEKLVSDRYECFQWRITHRRKGDDDKTKLKCWALHGKRCDTKRGSSTYENCEVPDCVIEVKNSGKMEISAKLKRVRDCGLETDSVLRIRRVK